MRKWSREIEHNRGERIITLLSEVYGTISDSYDLFLVGETHARIEKHADELNRLGARVIEAKQNPLPLKISMNPFLWFVSKPANFAYHIDPDGCMHSCLKLLEEYLLVDVIFCSQRDSLPVRTLLEDGTYSRASPEIFENEEHLVYGFDSDYPDYETGIQEFVSFGEKVPNELRSIFE